jgi:hypothetical protein
VRGTDATYEDVAKYLDAQGERYMALMVRQQTVQLRECREAAHETLRQYYALRDKIEPRRQHVVNTYRSPPESDG